MLCSGLEGCEGRLLLLLQRISEELFTCKCTIYHCKREHTGSRTRSLNMICPVEPRTDPVMGTEDPEEEYQTKSGQQLNEKCVY